MDRINGANTTDIGGGKRGFRAKNKLAGIAGTELTDEHMNALQEEILNVIEAGGLVPQDVDWTQLLQAVRGQRMNYRANAGTANDLAITLSPAPANLAALVGTPLRVGITAANTGAVTLAVNGFGAPVTWGDGTPLAGGDLPAGWVAEFVFNGSAYVLLTAAVSAAAMRLKFCILADVKANNAAGGTFTSGAWRTRDVNTVLLDPSGLTVGASPHVSVAFNRITLQAGYWLMEAEMPCAWVNANRGRIRNITASETVAFGPQQNANTTTSSDAVTVRARVEAFIPLSAPASFELQHLSGSSRANDGFGMAASALGAADGQSGIFSTVKITRL